MSSANGRAKLVKEVRKKIDELGITYIYYQFISVTGRIVGKGIPADHWERTAEKGFQLVYGSTANLFTDRHGQYIGYGPEASELIGIPDPETFCQLPWDKRVARVFCVCFRNREEDEEPGGFLSSDCRGNLKRHHAEFRKKHGMQLRMGCEPEMMWLKKDEAGNPAGGASKPYCYHIDQFESLRPVSMRVIEYARQMGLDMIQGDHEDAPGQLELNFTYDDALRTADRLSTYRQICSQVAREFGLIACFMSKPFMGVSANGCHTNISLWSGGEDKVLMLGNKDLPGLEGCVHLRHGRRQPFHARRRQAPEEAGAGRPALRRRRDRASAGADRDRLLDRQLLPPPVGPGLLGAGLRRLGLPEPHLRPAHLGPRPVRVPRRRQHGEPLPPGLRAC